MLYRVYWNVGVKITFYWIVMFFKKLGIVEDDTGMFIYKLCCTGCSKKTDLLVYFDDNFCKYGPIITIFSPLQQVIHDAHKFSYFSHLTFIILPLYLAKQTPMLVSMWTFLYHATKQISMYSNGWNIYLLIYSNALWCHHYVIIVFARLPFDCPVTVGFLKQTSNTCLWPSLSRKLCY